MKVLGERTFGLYHTNACSGVNRKSNKRLSLRIRIANVPVTEIGKVQAMSDELTQRQLTILHVIRDAVRERGFPPSIREIGDSVGLKSPSSVHHQLAALEKAGYIRRDPARPRAIELRRDPETHLTEHRVNHRSVPVVGDIAAGAPILADEHVDGVYALPAELVGDGTLFALHVRGESMIEAGVLPGDVVVIRQQPTVEQGEMCAALIDGEATVKFFRRSPNGEVFLDPANAAYEPIGVPAAAGMDSAILGRVVTVLRSL